MLKYLSEDGKANQVEMHFISKDNGATWCAVADAGVEFDESMWQNNQTNLFLPVQQVDMEVVFKANQRAFA